MELLDVLRVLRRRWLPALLTAVVIAGLFALLPTTMMPLPPSQAVTEVTLRLELDGTDAATVEQHKPELEKAATTDSTLVEARNLANVTPEYMKTGAKFTWRGPTTYDVTFTGPEREPTLALARDYTELVSRLDGRIIPGASVTASSTRDVIANQRVLPQEQKLGRKALSVPLGIVAGVVGGLIAAFVANALDRRVRGVQDLPTHGLTDAQILGKRSPEAMARVIAARFDGPVAVRGVGDADVKAVASGLASADDAPAVLLARRGVEKRALRDAIDATPNLLGVGLLR